MSIKINAVFLVEQKTSRRSTTGTPLEVFRVQRGQRYRFRFVNSMSHVCPVSLEIENHSLLVIASDSFDVQPVTVDSLVSTSGERYDFVIAANQSSGGKRDLLQSFSLFFHLCKGIRSSLFILKRVNKAC
jgi:FtsP/CotA-like multicopper oxidase with cupredoxin domain